METYEDCVVARYAYEKACTSAYFDATGTRILSTSYDDTIRGAFFSLLSFQILGVLTPLRSLGRD